MGLVDKEPGSHHPEVSKEGWVGGGGGGLEKTNHSVYCIIQFLCTCRSSIRWKRKEKSSWLRYIIGCNCTCRHKTSFGTHYIAVHTPAHVHVCRL